MYINPEYLANVLLFVGLCVAFLDLSPIFGSEDTAEQDTNADDQATPPEVIDPETLLPDPETPDPDTTVTENDPLPSYIAGNYGESATGTAEADFMSTTSSAALFGLEGDDQIQGSAENDYLEGDAGNDSMSGADGNDFAYGGSGNDTMYGMNGDDQLFGGIGDDLVEGNNGSDILDAGDGNDTLAGGAGLDALIGGGGNDLISSDRADNEADFSRGVGDSLNGGAGDDRLFFTTGDTVIGGEGADIFHMVDQTVDGADTAIINDFESGVDKIKIYYQPQLDELGDPIAPKIGSQIDSDANQTTVFVDDRPVLVVGQANGLTGQDIEFVLIDALDIT